MNVILIRHTAVAVDDGVCYGASDVSLAGTFEQEQAALRALLPPPPWRVVSSPSLRCRMLAGRLSPVPEIDERLAELNFGDWELRRWSGIPRSEIDAWCSDFVHKSPPRGEAYARLAARAEESIASLLSDQTHATALVVTHAGVIRALLAPRRDIALRDSFGIPVAFGGLYPIF